MKLIQNVIQTKILPSIMFTACVAHFGCGFGSAPEENRTSLFQSETINESDWELVYEDAFDVLDLTRYNTEYIWPRDEIINNEEQFYIDPTLHGVNPFSVDDGVLSISASPTPSSLSSYTSQPYVSGVLTSRHKFSQQYGRFEIRAKLPAGQGLWPAFWLLPTHDTWPSGVAMLPELDVLEYLGDEGSVYHTTSHSNQNGSSEAQGESIDTSADLNDEFHTYSVVWDDTYLRWYFDNQLVFETSTPADFNHPKHFLLNLAIGGSWAGSPDANTSFPAKFEIDHVRIFTRRGVSQSDANVILDPPHNAHHLVYSDTSAQLFWEKGDNHPEWTEYDIYRDGNLVATTSSFDWMETELSAGTLYHYEIKARAASRSTSYPASIEVLTTGDSAGPILSVAPPTNIHAEIYGPRTVELFWARSSSPDIVYYEIWRGSYLVGISTSTSFLDEALEPGRAFTYQVFAINNYGTGSTGSELATGVTPQE